MTSVQIYFSSSLFLQRNLPSDDQNEANISRKFKVKQTEIKGKHMHFFIDFFIDFLVLKVAYGYNIFSTKSRVSVAQSLKMNFSLFGKF